MKKAKGFVFFLVAVLILGLTCTSLVGIQTWYGEVKNTKLKGVENITIGADIGDRAVAVLVPSGVQEVTSQQLDSVCDIIEKRFSGNGYEGASVIADYEKGNVIIQFPLDSDYRSYDIENMISLASVKGNFEFRRGAETDSAGKPTGAIIVTSANIAKAQAGMSSETGYPAVYMQMDDEGTALVAEGTADMDGKVMTVWLDGEKIASPEISGTVTDGQAMISTDTFTREKVTRYAALINAGIMPFTLSTVGTLTVPSTQGELSYAVIAAIAMGVAVLVICAFLIVRYRMTGVVITLSILLQASVLTMMFTGYLNVFGTTDLTAGGILAIAVTLLMTVLVGVTQAQRISDGFASDRSLDQALRGGFKGGSAAVADAFILVFIIGFIFMAGFGTSTSVPVSWFGGFMTLLGITDLTVLSPLSYVLVWGSLLNLIITLFVSRMAMYSAGKVSFLRQPKFFGGASK